jgi:uroporphyrinogen-III synthase
VAEATLSGFIVGITADRRWEEQAELLRRRGASVMHGPTIRTLPIGPEDDLQRVTDQLILDPPAVVIANTGIGMRAWFAAADAWGIGEALQGTLTEARIFARGPKASSAVHQSGLDVTARAESERMDELVDLVIASGVQGCRVAFQRHGDDSPEAILRLEAAGATVIEVPVYRWILPLDLEPARRLIEATVQRRLHAVTFTSAPAVRNLFLVAKDFGLETELRDALCTSVIPVVVGPVCAQAAVDEGVNNLVVPERFRIGPMVRSLTDALLTRGRRATINGHAVSLQGRILQLGDVEVSLSEREADLLAVLLDAAPRVVSRADLLTGVWDSLTDSHVVEVTVGRLRRRVPELAEGIVAVPRRGYAVRP